MGSETFHEPRELLTQKTMDMHRAIVSLIEELEAIDWYQQRAEACADPALREILLHNKNEEIEHALMTLEWIRRHDSAFDANARVYLFTEQPITTIEGKNEVSGNSGEVPSDSSSSRGCLAIGSLKK